METDSFSSPLSDSYTASPSSPPRALSEISTYSNFPAIPLENRDFGADFASMYHAIFPPNLPLPSSLSLTPSTHSSFSGDDDATVTEQRLNQACLILECQEIRDRFELCRAHLQEISKQVEFLRRENAELRSANTELVKLLSSQTTFQSFLLSSAHPNRSFMDDFGRLNVGRGAPESHGSEEVSNISPTSVMENNRFQRRPNRERISLPKSISVRSSGYLKVNRPASASHDGPSRSTTRPQVPSPLVSGTQKVYVPGGVISNGAGKREEEEAAAAAALEMEVYNQGMFKTELCNKWQDTGTCPYGDHCQFAHGIKELRPVIRHPRYKTEVCRMVLAGDKCPYGHRCHFRHSLTEQEKLQLGTH